MASFIESLWNSVFTPGPTPPLLLATNVTFGALQLLLFALLLATYSVHFLVLSFLSGGLWWAINWFASELMAAQAAEEKNRKEKEELGGDGAKESGDDTETEVEEQSAPNRGSRSARGSKGTGILDASTALPSQADLVNDEDRLRRRKNLAESTGDLSTDSEWEKVEDDR